MQMNKGAVFMQHYILGFRLWTGALRQGQIDVNLYPLLLLCISYISNRTLCSSSASCLTLPRWSLDSF